MHILRATLRLAQITTNKLRHCERSASSLLRSARNDESFFSQCRYIMKKHSFVILSLILPLLFTSCLADYLNEKFGYTAPVYINYNSPYGDPPKRKQVYPGTELTEEDLPKLYAKEDVNTNEFQGWFLDQQFTNPALPGYVVEKSITLYAQWKHEYVENPDTLSIYKVEFSFFDPDSGSTSFEYNSTYDEYFTSSEDAMGYVRYFEGYEYIPGAEHIYTYDDYSNDTYRPITVYVKRYYKTHISANSFYDIGYYLYNYDNFTYNFYITDYNPNLNIYTYAPDTNLHLEDCLGLTRIPDNTFTSCLWLKEISLPINLSEIGENAFYDCSNLVKVDADRIVTEEFTLGQAAFRSCSSLENIRLPCGLKKIDSQTFADCTNLRSIRLPNTLNEIVSGSFENCNNLTDVYYQDTAIPTTLQINDATINAIKEAGNWHSGEYW